MKLTNSQRMLLETIHRRDGEWNWYELGRYCLGRIDSPADFQLKALRESGLIVSRPFEGEPLQRLYITDKGRAALEAVVLDD